jgi:hypothetical protein
MTSSRDLSDFSTPKLLLAIVNCDGAGTHAACWGRRTGLGASKLILDWGGAMRMPWGWADHVSAARASRRRRRGTARRNWMEVAWRGDSLRSHLLQSIPRSVPQIRTGHSSKPLPKVRTSWSDAIRKEYLKTYLIAPHELSSLVVKKWSIYISFPYMYSTLPHTRIVESM